jgi:hypothetical protein
MPLIEIVLPFFFRKYKLVSKDFRFLNYLWKCKSILCIQNQYLNLVKNQKILLPKKAYCKKKIVRLAKKNSAFLTFCKRKSVQVTRYDIKCAAHMVHDQWFNGCRLSWNFFSPESILEILLKVKSNFKKKTKIENFKIR